MEQTNTIPKHIAIIMDGNGRWAQKRGMPRTAGHKEGSEAFRRIADYCNTIGVKYLTVYAFSTENWKRSETEVNAIMQLLEQYLLEAIRDMAKNKVRFCFFGEMSRLNQRLRSLIQQVETMSEEYTLQVNICLNYGGRDEIVHAVRALSSQCLDGTITPDSITEETVSRALYSKGIPEPELLIRPGGEQRISNFLLWQCAYSEFYFTDVLWPDFDNAELDKAIAAYQQRCRRFGGV